MLFQRINPTQFIPLSYSLGEGVNSPTRFVQSKIIRSSDRSVISTVNLTDNGSGEFSNFSTVVPTILQSENLYFEVNTVVYTDAAYAQADPNYSVGKEIYLVKTEMGGAILGGGREIYHDIDTEVLTKDLVKAFFSFNKMTEIKDEKSFAKRLLNFMKEGKEKRKESLMFQAEIKKDMSLMINSLKENFNKITNGFSETISLFNPLKNGIIKNFKTEIGNIHFEDKTEKLKEEFDLKLNKSNESLFKKFDVLNNQTKEIIEEIKETEKTIKSGDMFMKPIKELPELAKQLKELYQTIKNISDINSKMKETILDIKIDNMESQLKIDK